MRGLPFLLLVLVILPSASAEDIEILTRPDSVVVETFPGNLSTMERIFFHIVLRNTSQAPVEVQWVRFDLLGANGAMLSGQYSGPALTALFDGSITRRRIEATLPGSLTIRADERKAVSDIFFDCPSGFVGDAVAVEVSYKSGEKVATVKTLTPLKRGEGFTGRLPFDGAWYVAAEHGYLDAHKRFLTEAFAYDFLQIGAGGRSFQGNGTRNTDYYAYGKKVRAAKDGTVVAARNDIIDNMPGTTNVNTPDGNTVTIDHGDRQFGYYAHLRPSSIVVKAGSKVRAGDPIGEVGNSGDSREPHLHFHVMNDADPAKADGLPLYFASWKALAYGVSAEVRQLGVLPRGEFVEPAE